MAQSLYEIVSNSSKQNKSSIGYTVSNYSGVLQDLQQQLGTVSQGNNVFGVSRVDYSGVSNLNFDKNGFSMDDRGIWKMVITTTGACPVKYKQAYDIACFQHESNENVNRNPFGNVTEMCPTILSEDVLKSITVQNFKIGCAIDLHNLGLLYFRNYYTDVNVSLTNEMITKLLVNGCIRAQIIFPNNNKSVFVDVIQHTPFSNMACIYLSTPIASASEWKECGIDVNISVNDKILPFIPNGTQYVSAVDGQGYYTGKGTMSGMTKSNYQKWVNNRAQKYLSPPDVLKLKKTTPKECFVKLFVPLTKQAEAMEILPKGINQNIFKQYQGEIKRGQSTDYGTFSQGDLGVSLLGIAEAWSGVKSNSGAGSIHYKLGTKTFIRGAGGFFYSSSGKQIKPTFGLSQGVAQMDCSSLACFLLYNCSAIREDIQSLTAFSTSNMLDLPNYLNNGKLYPNYKAVILDCTKPEDVMTGDIIFCNASDKGKYNGRHETYGHAAFAYKKENMVYTLEIGSSNYTGTLLKKSPRNNNFKNGMYFYKKIIRIIKV